jgi:hypothetical protein
MSPIRYCMCPRWEIRQISRRPEVSIMCHENCNVTFQILFPFDPQRSDQHEALLL